MRHLLFAAGAICLVGSASAAELVVNGSFEVPEQGPSDPFDTYPAGSPLLTGWTIQSGSIDHVASFWEAADGDQSVDMNGNTSTPGSIFQDLVTTPGETYLLSFALAGNANGNPDVKTLNVLWDGASIDQPTFDTTNTSNSNMGWVEKSYFVTASGAITRLQFTSLTPGAFFGPALDAVSVTAVPLPSAAWGGIALLGGLAASRCFRRRKPV